MKRRLPVPPPTILLALLWLTLPGFAEDAAKLTWTSTGINEARRTGKPILLCVCDPAIERPDNELGRRVEAIFDNRGVRSALADFTRVRLKMTASYWPPNFRQAARNGFLIYVMTCDARPVAVFTPQNIVRPAKDPQGRDCYPRILAAAGLAQKRNDGALQAMTKNPPKDYVSPEEIAARKWAARKAANQSQDEKKGLSGLLGDEAKKADAPVSSPPTATKPETGGTPVPPEKEEE